MSLSATENFQDITYILFDCDGVLVDSEILATQVALRMLLPFGYESTPREHAQRFSGMMDTRILEIIAEEKGIQWPADFYPNLQNAFKKAFKEELMPIAGMPELISRLRLPRAVVSNSGMDHVVTSLTQTGMLAYFGENRFSAQQVAHPKPAPDLYLHAMHTLGIHPAQGVVVEDSSFGVQAARAAGLRVIGFLGAGHIFDGHDRQLMDAGATVLARNAGELEQLLRHAFDPAS
jgi:HAD superfamily hydrolase (TIGR01509 family)